MRYHGIFKDQDIEKILSESFFSDAAHKERLLREILESPPGDRRDHGISDKIVSYEKVHNVVTRKREPLKEVITMAEFDKLNDQEVAGVAGGTSQYAVNGWMTVCRLQTGYLAMRTQPTYDYSNEIKGAELYNGDQVQTQGSTVQGTDGRTYIKAYSPKTATTGYVNYSFLA